MRTPAELLADAAHLAATERTAGWLDQLTDDGLITRGQPATDRRRGRRRLADPHPAPRRARRPRPPARCCAAAVAERPLDGARNTTNVLYSRIADQGRFDPVGESWADWTPRVDNPEWRRLPHRPRRCGRRPRAASWAARSPRTRRRGRSRLSAPYRSTEVRACRVGAAGGDRRGLPGAVRPRRRRPTLSARRPSPGRSRPTPPTGPRGAPSAAPRSTGRRRELSDGQLRMRVRACEREKPWAPRYVGNELAGTRQAAAHQHQTAALRAGAKPTPPKPPATTPGTPGSPGRPPTRPRSPHALDEQAADAAAARRRPRPVARPHRHDPGQGRTRRRPCSPNATPPTSTPNPSSPPRSGSPLTAPATPPTTRTAPSPTPTWSACRRRGRRRPRRRHRRPEAPRPTVVPMMPTSAVPTGTTVR